ncbi:MAG: biopolymer transporter ExbD [Candidatus Omnitrophica bacterium]|nr:biopolymer transporter ExbD [Candidatus Omnitrophota bacterium]
MKRHSRKQRFFADINITPFTDVILVLLVIFMVATPLIYQSNIKVKLPKAKTAEPRDVGQTKQAVITITTEGMVYLDDKLMTHKELREKIVAMHRENEELSVYLRADQLTRFKDIVDILDLLTEMGVAKLDIAATHVQ